MTMILSNNPLFEKRILTEHFNLTFHSSFVFSDYCQESVYSENIYFSKKYMFSSLGGDQRWPQSDIWQIYDEIEVCPWKGIIEIITESEGNRKIDATSEAISNFLNTLNEQAVSLPAIYQREGFIALMLKGLPPSGQSGKSKSKKRAAIKDNLKNLSKSVGNNRNYLSNKVALKLDVFSSGNTQIPDIDNMGKFLIDAMKGLFFHDDSQVKEFHSRILSTKDISRPIELSSEPEYFHTFENISLGILIPLSQGFENYYVIQIEYM